MIWVLLILIAVLALCALIDHKSRPANARALPEPISEDAFMAKCAPGTDRDVALRVRRVVAETLGIDVERVHPDSRFVDDLGADVD